LEAVRSLPEDQPFQILCTLLEHPGELVSRERLRQQLWPEGTFVDFEHGLNTAIKKLRDVLSDDPDNPRYIETVPRKGYRFLVPVNRDGLQAILATPASRRRPWQLRAPLLIVGMVLVIGIMALVFRGISYPPYFRISATSHKPNFRRATRMGIPISPVGFRPIHASVSLQSHRRLVYGKSILRVRVRDGMTEKVLSFRDMIASPECWAWNVAADGSLLISCVRPNSNIYRLQYE
jgi:DNA-binding winged helix-turn-helix (wHTH) protein